MRLRRPAPARSVKRVAAVADAVAAVAICAGGYAGRRRGRGYAEELGKEVVVDAAAAGGGHCSSGGCGLADDEAKDLEIGRAHV